MHRRVLVVLSGGMLVFGPASMAQVVVPAPAPTPATPAYEPPSASPKPPAPPPPAPEITPPDIIKRGADGKIIETTEPLDEVALAALKLDEAKKELREKILAERAAMMDRLVARNTGHAIKLRELFRKIDKVDNLSELMAYGDDTRALQLQPGIIQNMVTASAITQREAEAANKAVQAYGVAFNKQINDAANGDRMITGPAVARSSVKRLTLEPMRSYNRMALEAANHWNDVKARVTVEGPKDLEAALSAAKDDAAKIDAMTALLMALPEPAQAAVMEAVARPLPTPRLIPDPAPRPAPPKPGEKAATPAKPAEKK